ncbi:MAG TPA: MBL fold metallo-hydrolase [Candidatus Nanopelagicaceae bacterium]|nr:MBL fold metallo-hydrolase [Candidatus Nanopelagicaceae bacterium]
MKSVPTIRFLGAAGTVTGSRFLLEQDKTRVLIDAGMFQGLKELRLKNWDAFPIKPESINAIALTHAHLDHSGYLPLLVREGFSGPIYLTEYTAKLAEVVLRDSAHLQTEDAAYAARKGFSKHSQPLPLYDDEDVTRTVQLFRTVSFRQRIEIAQDTAVTFHPSGHILGASFIDVEFAGKRLLFTGDMGRNQHPLLVPPDHFPSGHFDAVLTESTYGDRKHESPTNSFRDAINRTISRGGTVIIPAFAVDRTEVILMELHRLIDYQEIKRVPIYVDSPMALTTLEYYRDALHNRSPEIRIEIVSEWSSGDPFDPGDLHEMRSVEDSKKLNDPHTPCIIISASGMATGGRVVHHLAGSLPHSENSVILVGYQAVGTRGRLLEEGALTVKIHGELIPVKAEILAIEAFSVHADSAELLSWLSGASQAPDKVFVVHGEQSVAEKFASTLKEELNWNCEVPKDGQQFPI